MFRPGNLGHLGRLGLVAASRPSLVAQALAILAKYGSAANLYLPGVGAVSGITAGNWLDSIGTTAATVDNPVGLVVSAGKAVGPELVTSPNVAGLPAGGGTRFYSLSSKMSSSPVANKTYQIRYQVTGYTGTGNVGLAGSAPAGVVQQNHTADGVYESIQTVTASGVLALFTSNSNTCNFVLLTISELPGAHLTQSTAANRPVLRQSGGVYAWQFDGSNDRFNSALITGKEGWFCAGVAFDSTQDAYSAVLYAGEVDVSKKSVYLFRGTQGFNARRIALAISDGTNRYILNSPAQVAIGAPNVVDCGWSSVQRFISVNGSVTSESSANTYGPSAGAAQIGTYFGTNNLNGRLFPIFFAPTVLPDASERATLRQFIASLSGVTF